MTLTKDTTVVVQVSDNPFTNPGTWVLMILWLAGTFVFSNLFVIFGFFFFILISVVLININVSIAEESKELSVRDT